MSRVVCEIVLSQGQWSYCPTRLRVQRRLRQVFGDSLLVVTFHDSDDGAIDTEASVAGDEDSCEGISDAVFRAFLEWRPEFESMIDVSVAVD